MHVWLLSTGHLALSRRHMTPGKQRAPLATLLQPYPRLCPESQLYSPLLDFIQSQVVNPHRQGANDPEVGSCGAENTCLSSWNSKPLAGPLPGISTYHFLDEGKRPISLSLVLRDPPLPPTAGAQGVSCPSHRTFFRSSQGPYFHPPVALGPL